MPRQARVINPWRRIVERLGHSCRSETVRWALTLAEREESSRGMAADSSVRQIAAKIGRAPLTVSREIRRHGVAHTYRASVAAGQAWARATPQAQSARHIPHAPEDRCEQITAGLVTRTNRGRLKLALPDQDTMRVSHDTIYRSLFLLDPKPEK